MSDKHDIVARLRSKYSSMDGDWLHLQAAEEIVMVRTQRDEARRILVAHSKSLEKEIERLRDARERIGEMQSSEPHSAEFARDALAAAGSQRVT